MSASSSSMRAPARTAGSGAKVSSGVRFMRAWRPMAPLELPADARRAPRGPPRRRPRPPASRRRPRRGAGRRRCRPTVMVTSSRRSSSRRSSSSARISRTSSLRRAVRGYCRETPWLAPAASSLDLHPVALGRHHLDLGERPHEPLDRRRSARRRGPPTRRRRRTPAPALVRRRACRSRPVQAPNRRRAPSRIGRITARFSFSECASGIRTSTARASTYRATGPG